VVRQKHPGGEPEFLPLARLAKGLGEKLEVSVHHFRSSLE
jgi:hypothetical protein